jgi:hypothetical protein
MTRIFPYCYGLHHSNRADYKKIAYDEMSLFQDFSPVTLSILFGGGNVKQGG